MMRIREDAKDSNGAGDVLAVEPLETATHHFRRGSVPANPSTAKAERVRASVVRWVDRCEQQRSPVEKVGGVELDLAVEVGPVGRETLCELVPLGGERARSALAPAGRRSGGGRRLLVDELQPAGDSLLVEALQHASETVRAAVHEEVERPARPSRHRRRQNERGAIRILLAVDGQLEVGKAPAPRESAEDLVASLREGHDGRFYGRVLAFGAWPGWRNGSRRLRPTGSRISCARCSSSAASRRRWRSVSAPGSCPASCTSPSGRREWPSA